MVRQGDFEALYAQHARPLLAFLAYRTGDPPLAEDLLGETFERVLRHRRRFDPRRGSEKTWIYTIALNCLRDHARRRAAEGRALERAIAPVAVPHGPPDETIGERDELQRALVTLTTEEREAIALRFGADLSLKEIARIIGESESTAEGRVYRALRKLRERMA